MLTVDEIEWEPHKTITDRKDIKRKVKQHKKEMSDWSYAAVSWHRLGSRVVGANLVRYGFVVCPVC